MKQHTQEPTVKGSIAKCPDCGETFRVRTSGRAFLNHMLWDHAATDGQAEKALDVALRDSIHNGGK